MKIRREKLEVGSLQFGVRPSSGAATDDSRTGAQRYCARGRARSKGVALVVTLLMLSVITFMAVAFLAVSRRERASVTGSLNQADAQTMADAALARAQTEIAAYLMAHNTNATHAGRPNDLLNYELMMSHNYINPDGFTPGVNDPTNVNYDYHDDPTRTAMSSANQADWVQNIANLLYDPRPPVFLQTNTSLPNNLDFRYWLDYNRNGRFESNGPVAVTDDLLNTTGAVEQQFGEPEWVGSLRQSDAAHGPGNPFVGRFAYLVLPIGKTLDLNRIHNYAKATANPANFPQLMNTNVDGYLRNQGHGPWELNLAGLLAGVNSNLWGGTNYVYSVDAAGIPNLKVKNSGNAFVDAVTLLGYRYNYANNNLNTLSTLFPGFDFTSDRIDEYADGPIVTNAYDSQYADTDNADNPWPGSTNYNNFYDPQELFDRFANDGSGKPFPFYDRLTNAMAQNNTTNRYTFSRLLNSIGTDSDPELYCWVHADNGKLVKRAKVNINFDNSAQIQAYNADPIHNKLTTPAALTNWDALNFFTNSAELLLRSQDFEIVTNDIAHTNQALGTALVHFGVTNIMVYSSANTNIHYSAAIHRMLQLAANIYDTSGNNVGDTNTGVMYPSVFRPIFDMQFEPAGTARAKNFDVNIDATNLYIVGFTTVFDTGFATNAFRALSQVGSFPVQPNDNVWGIPLVIGAKKGLPNFNKCGIATAYNITRKLFFHKSDPANVQPNITGYQMNVMTISNLFGVEGWNSYIQAFPRAVNLYVTNFGQIALVNEKGIGTNATYTNYAFRPIPANLWTGNRYGASDKSLIKSNAFQLFLTNVVTLPNSQYVEDKDRFQLEPTEMDFTAYSKFPLGYPVHSWTLTLTNYVLYIAQDQVTKRVLDMVNVGDFTNGLSLNEILDNRTAVPPDISSVWTTNGANNTLSSPMSDGVKRQLDIVTNYIYNAEWPNTPQNSLGASNFVKFLNGNTGGVNQSCPYQPSAMFVMRYRLQANDPLVHYTFDDLAPTNSLTRMIPIPATTGGILNSNMNFGQANDNYSPWNMSSDPQDIRANVTFKDPMITQPLMWDFPTNKFPSTGWLGRVHRGTPWQTFYLKSEATDTNRVAQDHKYWLRTWAHTLTSYPTNDWRILDLFTVALNEESARGLLSINQTNLGPWSALLSGVFALTNNSTGGVIDPAQVPQFVTALNARRAREDNGVFHHLGDFLVEPLFTRTSPFVPFAEAPPSNDTNSFNWDVVLERIPQQVLSLVKLGDPKFVIYSWGQSLKPANNSIVLGGTYRGMCTNYQITGEMVTRTVCHLSPDSTPSSPKLVIDSFNILPGN
jgi:hypothetical protein